MRPGFAGDVKIERFEPIVLRTVSHCGHPASLVFYDLPKQIVPVAIDKLKVFIHGFALSISVQYKKC